MFNKLSVHTIQDFSKVIVLAGGVGLMIWGQSSPISITKEARASSSQPSLARDIDLPGGARVNDLFAAGEYIYVATNVNSGLLPEFYIFDARTQDQPVLKGSLDIGVSINKIFGSSSTTVYAATGKDSQELIVINVTNKSSPQIVGSYNIHGSKDALSIFADGPIVYVGTARDMSVGGREFYIFNVTNPASIVLLGSFEIDAAVNDIFVADTIAYLATTNSTKEVMSVSVANPSVPRGVSFYNITGNAAAHAIVLNQSMAYVVTDNHYTRSDVFALNVNRLTGALSYAGGIDLGKNNFGLEVWHNLAFVVSDGIIGNLTTIDISRPSAMKQIGTVSVGGPVFDVATINTALYLATSRSTKEIAIAAPRVSRHHAIADINGDGEVHISCLGDSNTDARWWAGPTWCETLKIQLLYAGKNTWHTYNHGHAGGSIYDFGYIFGDPLYAGSHIEQAVVGDNADVVILAYGTNDVLYRVTQPITFTDIVEAYRHQKNSIETAMPGARVFFALTPPTSGTSDRPLYDIVNLNATLLRSLPYEYIVDFYQPMIAPDDFQDSTHMNAQGQGKRALAVFNKLVVGK